MPRLNPLYKTGRLGLTNPQIEAEEKAIEAAVCKRHPRKCHGSAALHHYSLEEIHRDAVLSAMGSANALLIYGWSGSWPEGRKEEFIDPELDWIGKNCLDTRAQKQAHLLTEKELDHIWAAQEKRVAKATIKHGVYTDNEGCSYNSIDW